MLQRRVRLAGERRRGWEHGALRRRRVRHRRGHHRRGGPDERPGESRRGDVHPRGRGCDPGDDRPRRRRLGGGGEDAVLVHGDVYPSRVQQILPSLHDHGGTERELGRRRRATHGQREPDKGGPVRRAVLRGRPRDVHRRGDDAQGGRLSDRAGERVLRSPSRRVADADADADFERQGLVRELAAVLRLRAPERRVEERAVLLRGHLPRGNRRRRRVRRRRDVRRRRLRRVHARDVHESHPRRQLRRASRDDARQRDDIERPDRSGLRRGRAGVLRRVFARRRKGDGADEGRAGAVFRAGVPESGRRQGLDRDALREIRRAREDVLDLRRDRERVADDR
mmetsp:Transcript_8991/g.32846  ORF Transcript_8991/g.32846 Transcript_8991/m.32846 type:complete len:339 (-) Transcript_8991:347-1363(-)